VQGESSEIDARRLRRWAITARILLGLYAAVALLPLLGGAWLLSLELGNGYGYGFALVMSPFLWLAHLVMVLAAIPVLGWFFRARTNLARAGHADLAYSPGWATFSFLVPFANLVVPYRSARELWHRSHGEDVYQSLAAVPQVSTWWTCLLAGGLIVAILTGMAVFDRLTYVHIVTPPGANTALCLFAIVLLAGSAISLFRIIGTVTRAQRDMIGIDLAFA